MKQAYSLNINGVMRHVACEPDTLLLDLIREELRLTGTKCGCGIGVCGSCTVLIDGKAKLACRVKIKDVARNASCVLRGDFDKTRDAGRTTHDSPDGPQITTIEGLEMNGKLHPIQQAFIDCGAIQCGFCTPGMVLQAKALLARNPKPTRAEIRKALAGNLCRCTGYQQIFEAVEMAAKRMGGF